MVPGLPRVAPPLTALALSLSRSFRLRLSASSISPIGLNSSISSNRGSLPLASFAILPHFWHHHSFVTADLGQEIFSTPPALSLCFMGLTAPTIIRRLSSLCEQQRGFEQQGLNGLQGRLIDHVTAHPVHIGMQFSSQILGKRAVMYVVKSRSDSVMCS